MSDARAELAELADRVERGTATGSLDSERAVQLRAVEPLVELLGWDVRGPAVVPATSLNEEPVDYLLLIDDEPAVAVRTATPGSDAIVEAVDGLERVITTERDPGGAEDEPVPRGIATDGRTLVLLVADGDEMYRRDVEFASLPDHANALGQFHRSVLEGELAERRTDRRRAGRRLAANREAVIDGVVAEILSVAGEDVRDVVETESTRAVDAIVDALDSDVEPDTDQSSTERDSRDAEHSAKPEPEPSTRVDSSEVARSDSQTGGEYVARFFGGSSSVGAVGTETPEGTIVGVVRYLLENQELRSAVTLPWVTEAGTPVVDDHRRSEEWVALTNQTNDAIYVRPIEEPATAKAAIAELAEAVGLRVMFQGDW